MRREGKQGTDVMWEEPSKITQKIHHSLNKDSQKRNKTHNKNFWEKLIIFQKKGIKKNTPKFQSISIIIFFFGSLESESTRFS